MNEKIIINDEIYDLKSDNEEETLIYFEALTLPLTLQYYKILRKEYLISFEELRSLVDLTYFVYLNKTKNKIIYDKDRYFKYLYLQMIKSEIKRLNSTKERINRKALMLSLNDENGLNRCEEIKIFDEKLKGDELIRLILRDKRSHLSPKEKEILYFYTYDLDIKEIAKEMKLSFSVVSRHLKKSFEKSKNYIEKYLSDIKK